MMSEVTGGVTVIDCRAGTDWADISINLLVTSSPLLGSHQTELRDIKDFLLSLNRSWQENCDHAPFAGTPLSSALLFDAVYAVVAAVQELNRSQNVGATQLSCKSSKIWEHGTSLMNYLRMVELEGLTGHIEFNSKGQRSNYALRIMQNSRDGLRQ
ncbi:unnamed protein product, partial [Coregonus sp. 'balchen']